jgi:hypothetical protein
MFASDFSLTKRVLREFDGAYGEHFVYFKLLPVTKGSDVLAFLCL